MPSTSESTILKRPFTASRSFCLNPRYRSVVSTDACPRRNWICSSSPRDSWHQILLTGDIRTARLSGNSVTFGKLKPSRRISVIEVFQGSFCPTTDQAKSFAFGIASEGFEIASAGSSVGPLQLDFVQNQPSRHQRASLIRPLAAYTACNSSRCACLCFLSAMSRSAASSPCSVSCSPGRVDGAWRAQSWRTRNTGRSSRWVLGSIGNMSQVAAQLLPLTPNFN